MFQVVFYPLCSFHLDLDIAGFKTNIQNETFSTDIIFSYLKTKLFSLTFFSLICLSPVNFPQLLLVFLLRLFYTYLIVFSILFFKHLKCFKSDKMSSTYTNITCIIII